MPNATPPGAAVPTPKVDFSLDEKTKQTVLWSAILYAAQRVVQGVISWIGFRYFAGGLVGRLGGFGGYALPLGSLVNGLIWGAVQGAIFGFVLAKYWGWFQNLNRKTIKATNYFKFLFIFNVVISVVLTLLLSFTAFFVGALPLVINLIGLILGAYIYAQGMSKKVGHLYQL